MPKITTIKQQQKRRDRYSIYVDSKYSFSLSENELVKLELSENQELSQQQLQVLQAEATVDKAYDRVLRLLSHRPRSQYEITTYLQRKEYDPEVIATVSHKLIKLELLDDAKFARQWVQWRLNTSHKSVRQLRAELLKKGVNKDIIDEALSAVDDQTELAQLKALIARKSRLSQYQDRQKLMAYLARQGYNYDSIKQALKELD